MRGLRSEGDWWQQTSGHQQSSKGDGGGTSNSGCQGLRRKVLTNLLTKKLLFLWMPSLSPGGGSFEQGGRFSSFQATGYIPLMISLSMCGISQKLLNPCPLSILVLQIFICLALWEPTQSLEQALMITVFLGSVISVSKSFLLCFSQWSGVSCDTGKLCRVSRWKDVLEEGISLWHDYWWRVSGDREDWDGCIYDRTVCTDVWQVREVGRSSHWDIFLELQMGSGARVPLALGYLYLLYYS